MPQTNEFILDPATSPSRILPGQPQNRRPHRTRGRREDARPPMPRDQRGQRPGTQLVRRCIPYRSLELPAHSAFSFCSTSNSTPIDARWCSSTVGTGAHSGAPVAPNPNSSVELPNSTRPAGPRHRPTARQLLVISSYARANRAVISVRSSRACSRPTPLAVLHPRGSSPAPGRGPRISRAIRRRMWWFTQEGRSGRFAHGECR